MSKTDKIPSHVAIIMDGNGRWARARGLERHEGHRAGVNSLRNVIARAARNPGVRYLTLYVFSTENWGRPQEEVDMLMELLCRSIVNELDELLREQVKVVVIGERAGMSKTVVEHIELIERETAACTELTILLCINYSPRGELTRAARRLAEKAVSGELYTGGIPDPDLIIRTGGEQRLSNFLLWQGAYSELYFTPTYWPDFSGDDFDAAVAAYSGRHRRFGKVDEQE